MVTEIKYNCPICRRKEWAHSIPDTCPDCEHPDVEKINTRQRNKTNGECSVGNSEPTHAAVNCQLIATYEADVKSEYGDNGYTTRKICDKHKKLWKGSESVLEIRAI